MKDVWVGYSVGHKWACSWAAVHGKYIGLVMGRCETVTVSNLLAHDWAVHHGAEGCCHSLNALLSPTNWVKRQHKIVFSVHSLSYLSHFWFLKSYSLVWLKTWYLHSLWDSTGLIKSPHCFWPHCHCCHTHHHCHRDGNTFHPSRKTVEAIYSLQTSQD